MIETNKKDELNLALKTMDKALTDLRAGLNILISMGLYEAPVQLSKLAPLPLASYTPPTREEISAMFAEFLETKGKVAMDLLREKYDFTNITSLLAKEPSVINEVIRSLKNE
jgi:hypothetical protein